MAEKFETVPLPNGNTIQVPEGTSIDEIIEFAVYTGKATREDFEGPGLTSQSMDLVGQTGDFLGANLDLPGGIAGSLAGAGAGFAVAGPVGALIGGVAGGMLGTAGGAVASDYMEGEDPDWQDAFDKAILSGGLDIATLGIGSKIKPFIMTAKTLGMTANEAAEMFVKEAAMDAKDLYLQPLLKQAATSELAAQAAKTGLQAGSPESLAASQAIAQETGGTLTRTQTGNAGALATLGEAISNIGLISSSVMKTNTDRVSMAAENELSNLFSRPSIYSSPETLASEAAKVVETGRSTLSVLYNEGIKKVSQDLGDKRVKIGPLKASFTKFMQSKQGEVFNELAPQTQTLIKTYKQSLDTAKDGQMKATELFTLDRMLNREISDLGGFNATNQMRSRAAELTKLSKNVRGAIQRSLQRTDPKVAAEYASIKKSYREGLQAIAPKMNSSILANASEGNFKQLGALLAKGEYSSSQIQAFMKSLDESYANIAKLRGVGGERATEVRKRISDLEFKTPAQAKDYIREAYIANLFPTLQRQTRVTGGGPQQFNIDEYSSLAKQFEIPDEAARMSAALGEYAPRVKQVMNLMAEASSKVDSNIGNIMVRSKEYQSVGQLAQLATTGMGVTGAGILGGIGGLGVLFTPVVLAKIATNPRAVNRLIAFENKKFLDEEQMILAANQLLAEAIDDMTLAQKQEVRETFKQNVEDDIVTRGQRQQQAVGM